MAPFSWKDLPNHEEELESLTDDELYEVFLTCRRECLQADMQEEEIHEWMQTVFSLPENIGVSDLDDFIERHVVLPILMLYRQCETRNMFDEVTPDTNDPVTMMRMELEQIFETILYASRATRNKKLAYLKMRTRDKINEFSAIDTYLGKRGDESEQTPFQKVLLYVLDKASEYGYRRVDDKCYEEIKTEAGHLTHAWREKCTVQHFIQIVCRKESGWDHWQHLTASKCDNAEQVHKYLCRCLDPEFPTLEPNRKVFSFQNGLYFIAQDMFYPFERRSEWASMAHEENQKRSHIEDSRTLNSEGEEIVTYVNMLESRSFEKCVAPTRSDVAIKYFDIDFEWDENCPWTAIETPEIEQLLQSQQLHEDTRHWMYIVLGRCLYELGEKDGWQVIPFIKGIAGSGKSTIAKIMKHMYPASCVGILSSNVEEKFGLSAIYDKLLYMCTEVKRDWGLNQGDFQSIVSAEEVSVPVKHEKAKTVTWKVPGLLMGNEVGKWVDTSGSIRRRILSFEYNFSIPSERSDPNLFEKFIKKSVGKFLRKINVAYLVAAHEHGDEDIWKKGILSEELHMFANNMRTQVDGLERFMQDRGIEGFVLDCDFAVDTDPDARPVLCMKFTDFKMRYQKFRAQHGYTAVKLDEDHFKLVFQQYGIVLHRRQKRTVEGREILADWLSGVAPSNTGLEDTSTYSTY